MDTSGIPKFFWYSLGLCMLIATCGFVFIGYKSSLVSIEIYNAKISLSSALETAKDIRSNLQDEVESIKKELNQLQNEANEPKTENKAATPPSTSSPDKTPKAQDLRFFHKKFNASGDTIKGIAIRFNRLDEKIQKAEQTIREVGK